MKRAFTLIELLVVIAIIAILAAILFPVFSQAKAAAKASANISNLRQTATAVLMYGGDNDDFFPLVGQYSAAPIMMPPIFSTPVNGGVAQLVSTWQIDIQPYMKNEDLLFNPLAGNPVALPDRTRFAASQHYGAMPVSGARGIQNFVVNSPLLTNNVPVLMNGIMGVGIVNNVAIPGLFNAPSMSQSAIDQPSQMTMVAEAGFHDMGLLFAPNIANVIDYRPNGNDLTGQAPLFANPLVLRNAGLYMGQQVLRGPHARRNVQNGAPGVGGTLNALPLGQTSMAATDGSARGLDYRGRMFERAIRADTTTVAIRLWPFAPF
jgi:prepilin-type N-terminal cleavage/methylation domain-containing protein